MTDTRRTRHPRRLATIALLLAVGGVLLGLGAAAGSGAGLWSFRPAFTALRWAFYAAALGGVLALAALIWGLVARAGGRVVVTSVLALALAAVFCAVLIHWVARASAAPPIHDISTDLSDPPQFRVLPLRPDNLDNIPDGDDPAVAALPPVERLHALQRRGYPEVEGATLPLPPSEAMTAVENLVRSRGWTIADVNRAAGTIEATDTVSLFRFKDDVVVRVRPAEGGSRIDLRSVSRVGGSDVGVNAARVKAFLADLSGSVPGDDQAP